MQKTKKLSTKQKIIQTSIELFNEQGAQNITSRHIAAKLGISHGNLDYHYKTKEALMIAIYEQMRTEMSESYNSRIDFTSSFEHFQRLLKHLDEFNLKYRFFNLDVLEISRSFPQLSRLLEETILLRKKQMEDLFKEFIQEGFIQEKSQKEYSRLQHHIRIIITFWLPQKEILSSFQSTETGEMVRHIWALLTPYFTPEGQKEYERVMKDWPV